MRCEQQEYEFRRLAAALEQAEIPFLPLKGVEMRDFCPEPWMPDGKLPMDTEKARKLLSESGLWKFAETCGALARVWLEDEALLCELELQ